MKSMCPQCTSDACGPVRCRFSMLSHEKFRDILRQADKYADVMIRRDKERPQWERDFKTGARDDNGWGRS